jgi:hypothetical protein
MMKKLIRFLLVLALGAFLGYVFHNTIDSKLKSNLGNDRVEQINSKTHRFAEKAGEAGKAAYKAGKDVIDSTENE